MSFSLEKKGTFQHYLINFQKELLRTISKSTTVTLLENYTLKVDGTSEGRARELGHEMNPDPVLNQLVFSIKFHVQEDTMTCGLLCFSLSNWGFPNLTDGRKWGEVFFPLVNIQNLDPLPRAISNRMITIGLTTGYLRQKTTKGKSSFVKADWIENEPCWVEQTIFDESMKEMLSKKKSIKLAEQKPYGAPSTTTGAIPKTPRKEKQDICFWNKDKEIWEAKAVEFNVKIPSNMPPIKDQLTKSESTERGGEPDFENKDQGNRRWRDKEEEPKFDHHSHPHDYRRQGGRNSQCRGEIPPAKHQPSLLDQPLRRREPPARDETEDEDLLNFETAANHQTAIPRQRPNIRDLERPNLRDLEGLNVEQVGEYDQPTYHEEERERRYRVGNGIKMPGPRDLETIPL